MQSEKVWFFYGAIAKAKGSEVGSRFGLRAQLGVAQAGGWRAGSGREIREGKECFGNWEWYRPEPWGAEKGKWAWLCRFIYLQTENIMDSSHVVSWCGWFMLAYVTDISDVFAFVVPVVCRLRLSDWQWGEFGQRGLVKPARTNLLLFIHYVTAHRRWHNEGFGIN